MQAGERLGALAGRWRTIRAIRHSDGTRARFAGLTEWRPDGRVLRCTEAGWLTQGGARFEARRVTLWRAGPAGIEVTFADHRPFHVVGNGVRPAARHDCPPDVYALAYDFTGWPRWSVRWQVAGPRKAYRALTRYRPDARP